MGGRTDGRRLDPLVGLALGLVLLAFLNLLTATLPAADELERMRHENTEAARTLLEVREERAVQEDRLDALRSDPFVVEAEMRRRLELLRPDEIVVEPPIGLCGTE